MLYALIPFPLGRLDADVLGGLYEAYVDEIDRDRLGQFYTPRAVVRFMLERAEFDGPEGVFHLEGDERRPKRVLVTAAERLVCALYGLSPELEEEVVRHALTRAASA